MRLLRKKKGQKNQGSAMIVAVVVGVVLMVFSLSLLLLSYSLFSSVTSKSSQIQCRELAKSVNQRLKEELTTTAYSSYDEQTQKAGSENALWFYLRYNLWQNNWPYYNEGELGHTETESYKYFTIETDGTTLNGVADQILITMYWELNDGKKNPATITDKNCTDLSIKITVEKGESSYTLQSSYSLSCGNEYTDEAENTMESISNLSINPNMNSIYKIERWTWISDN